MRAYIRFSIHVCIVECSILQPMDLLFDEHGGCLKGRAHILKVFLVLVQREIADHREVYRNLWDLCLNQDVDHARQDDVTANERTHISSMGASTDGRFTEDRVKPLKVSCFLCTFIQSDF